MQKKLQQQTKTIKYIKQKYKQKTGQQIMMPKSWQNYLDIDQDQIPIKQFPQIKYHNKQSQQNNNNNNNTFQFSIDKLLLPTRLSYNKTPFTSFIPTNKFHMVQYINLSNFKYHGFNKQLFRQFLGRIGQMRCLCCLNLQKNGIDESCAQEIQLLLIMKRITRLNLSMNQMGRSCLQIINKNFNHLQWIDFSRNYFAFQTNLMQIFLNSLRTNSRIYHICIDIQSNLQMHTFASYLKIKPHIHSFSPIDSHIDQISMLYICNSLQISSSKKQLGHLFSLNLQFCYLEQPCYQMLFKSLIGNNTLLQLNLKSNQLGNIACISLCKNLQSNITLYYLNVSNNLLSDSFILALANCLKKNQILQQVDISRNIITQQGAIYIYNCLSQHNDTIESLGQFQTNSRIGQQMLQKINKALKINKISKDIRSQLINEENQLTQVQISNRQTEAFMQAQYQNYELLVPIPISNPLKQDPFTINLWQFD